MDVKDRNRFLEDRLRNIADFLKMDVENVRDILYIIEEIFEEGWDDGYCEGYYEGEEGL